MKNNCLGTEHQGNSRSRTKGLIGLALAAGFLTTFAGGCMMVGNYHSAKTLEKGESSFGMTFGINRMSNDSDNLVIPNVIPELAFHVGVAKDWEVGGRVAPGSLGLELDTKYRFLHKNDLHMALAPAVGYQAIFDGYGATFRLPFVLSYDFTGNFGFNAAVFGGFSAYDSNNEDDDDWDFLGYLKGDIISYGVSLGPEIRGSVFFARPAFEFQRYQYRLDEEEESDGDNAWEPVNSFNVLVHFGWVFGREKQQLDRVEEKLDKALERKPEPERQ